MDRAWKKESAEAGDGLGQVLYQLFKKRRSAVPLVTKLRHSHEPSIREMCKVDVSYLGQQSNQRVCQLLKQKAVYPSPPHPSSPPSALRPYANSSQRPTYTLGLIALCYIVTTASTKHKRTQMLTRFIALQATRW